MKIWVQVVNAPDASAWLCVKDLGSGLALWRRYGVARARPLPMAYPGALYHITPHGNAQRKTWGQGLTLPYPHYPKRVILPRAGGGMVPDLTGRWQARWAISCYPLTRFCGVLAAST